MTASETGLACPPSTGSFPSPSPTGTKHPDLLPTTRVAQPLHDPTRQPPRKRPAAPPSAETDAPITTYADPREEHSRSLGRGRLRSSEKPGPSGGFFKHSPVKRLNINKPVIHFVATGLRRPRNSPPDILDGSNPCWSPSVHAANPRRKSRRKWRAVKPSIEGSSCPSPTPAVPKPPQGQASTPKTGVGPRYEKPFLRCPAS